MNTPATRLPLRFRPFALLSALALVALAGCTAVPPRADNVDRQPLALTILHLNDTHAKLEPALTELALAADAGGPPSRLFVELGGFPQLWAAVDHIRQEDPNTLFLHAGDVFQGSLFFTRFNGQADLDLLNAMGLDAMALGNHEFDKGPEVLAAFGANARFALLGANVDPSAEPSLAPRLRPYTIKTFGRARVGIIGISTEDTPSISSPGPNLRFGDRVEAIARCVAELEAQGVNKIVVVSHQGYANDLALAAKIRGVDVIVGGHSHTLVGNYDSLGLKGTGDYPTRVKDADGRDVLVVSAWQWGLALGDLKVEFDGTGRIVKHSGTARLVTGDRRFRLYGLPGADGQPRRVEYTRNETGADVREYDGTSYSIAPPAATAAAHRAAFAKFIARLENDPRVTFARATPEAEAKLAQYAASVHALQQKIATTAREDLRRGNNTGPGPLVADSMLWKTGAQLALMNPGGIRTDLAQGDISVAQIYELQPFENTLVLVDLTGAEIIGALEDLVDYAIANFGAKTENAFAYVAGARFTLTISAPAGQRISAVEIRRADGTFAPLDPAARYRMVVNSFLASGGDKNTTLAGIPAERKTDTGFVDSEVMLDFVQGRPLSAPDDIRIRNQP